MAEVDNFDIKGAALKIWGILHEYKVPLCAIHGVFQTVEKYITSTPTPPVPEIKEKTAPKEHIKADTFANKMNRNESEFQKEWEKIRETAFIARRGR